MFEEYQELTITQFATPMRKICAGNNNILMTLDARQ